MFLKNPCGVNPERGFDMCISKSVFFYGKTTVIHGKVNFLKNHWKSRFFRFTLQISYCIETLENCILAPNDVYWWNCQNTFHQCQITSEHFTGHKWAENMSKIFEELRGMCIHKWFFWKIEFFLDFLYFSTIFWADRRAIFRITKFMISEV